MAKWVISYDISEAKVRRFIVKNLRRYGFALQKSVYLCDLNKNQQLKLHNKLTLKIQAQDKIHFYKITYWQTEQDLQPQKVAQVPDKYIIF